MVEVFKTNITEQKQASKIIEEIQQTFPSFKINFDLEDCDNILRIENPKGNIDNELVCRLIRGVGYFIEPLMDG